MCLIKWGNNLTKRLRFPDISLIKLSTAGFVLMVAKLWPDLLSLEWYWYLIIALVAASPVIPKMFKK